MRVSKKILAGMSALSLVAVPTLASAAPGASRLSVAAPVARTGAATTEANEGRGRRGSGLIIGILALAAIIAGIVIAADNNNAPVSR